MKLHRVQGKIDITEWGGDFFPKLEDHISKQLLAVVSEALEIVFDTDDKMMGPRCNMPALWSGVESDGYRGPNVTDPLTIYIELPHLQNPEADDEVVVKMSVRECIEREIEEGGFDRGLKRISVGLRALSDEIDAAIAGRS